MTQEQCAEMMRWAVANRDKIEQYIENRMNQSKRINFSRVDNSIQSQEFLQKKVDEKS